MYVTFPVDHYYCACDWVHLFPHLRGKRTHFGAHQQTCNSIRSIGSHGTGKALPCTLISKFEPNFEPSRRPLTPHITEAHGRALVQKSSKNRPPLHHRRVHVGYLQGKYAVIHGSNLFLCDADDADGALDWRQLEAVQSISMKKCLTAIICLRGRVCWSTSCPPSIFPCDLRSSQFQPSLLLLLSLCPLAIK